MKPLAFRHLHETSTSKCALCDNFNEVLLIEKEKLHPTYIQPYTI